MNAARWISTVLVLVAIVAGLACWVQRETTAALQSELALLRDDHRVIARLRAEQQRLRAAQVPAAEVARLRADRAALLRLRAEIEQLQARAEQKARPEEKAVVSTLAERPAALSLKILAAEDGRLQADGVALDLDALKRRIAALPAGERVDLVFRVSGPAAAATSKATLDGLKAVVKESGHTLTARFEKGGM